jgi:hypothetical protein
MAGVHKWTPADITSDKSTRSLMFQNSEEERLRARIRAARALLCGRIGTEAAVAELDAALDGDR